MPRRCSPDTNITGRKPQRVHLSTGHAVAHTITREVDENSLSAVVARGTL